MFNREIIMEDVKVDNLVSTEGENVEVTQK